MLPDEIFFSDCFLLDPEWNGRKTAMPSDYQRMHSLPNLKRAYRWLQSNPDGVYKNYFRDTYTAYAAASNLALSRLARELGRGAFEATHATKVFLPKASGLLRPYTLLTMDDQLVYQACINIVADKLKPLVRSRYNKSVFGHLYAGKSSQFFYLKWQAGYKKFGYKVVEYIEGGDRFVANFDLTAFYDSIDHKVLSNLLVKIGVEDDLVDFMLRCLSTWSSSTWNSGQAIYHGHGIPQGPLSSGLLAEVLLKYFDDIGVRSGAKYLRYVDDIKIFAKSEGKLRQRLVALDLTSKEVGVFPQSSKVDISEVRDAKEQVKSVSNPPEPALRKKMVDQLRLRKRLLEITRRGVVKEVTRFKYLLAHAEPHSDLNERLLKVLRQQPAFSATISRYVSKYQKLPMKFGDGLLDYLRDQQIYHSANAEILVACKNNLQGKARRMCADYCEKRLLRPQKGSPKLQASLKGALWAWIISEQRIKFNTLESEIKREADSWVVKEIVSNLDESIFGNASTERIMNWAISSRHHDAARCAAMAIVENGMAVTVAHENISEAAKPILFIGRKIRSIGRPKSLVQAVLRYVLDKEIPDYDWKRFFGEDNSLAELHAFNVKSYFESSIDACILALDSLCDLIFDVVYGKVRPGVQRPNYGAALKDVSCTAASPVVCSGFKALHDLRIQSSTAHPRQHKTGAPTRRLKHHDYRNVRPQVAAAIEQIIATYP